MGDGGRRAGGGGQGVDEAGVPRAVGSLPPRPDSPFLRRPMLKRREGMRKGEFCEFCVERGQFCGKRPQSDCTRTTNGSDTQDDPRPETTHHCACKHECPCDARMELVSDRSLWVSAG